MSLGDDEEVSVFLVDSSVLESFHYLYSTLKKRHIYFIIPPTKWMLFHFYKSKIPVILFLLFFFIPRLRGLRVFSIRPWLLLSSDSCCSYMRRITYYPQSIVWASTSDAWRMTYHPWHTTHDPTHPPTPKHLVSLYILVFQYVML